MTDVFFTTMGPANSFRPEGFLLPEVGMCYRLKHTHLPLEFLHRTVQQPPLILDVILHVLELLLLSPLLK